MSVLTKNRSPILGAAVAALFASTAGAQTVPTFKISIGVRETGALASGVAIGENGGGTGNIEWVNKDGQTLTADGTWQKFTFNFGTDPVASFSGGNNVLDNGTKGVLEHLRFLNSGGTTDQITLLADDIVNTISGVDTVVQDFESNTAGQFTTFQTPNNSGSTSAFVTAGGTSKVITTAAHSGSNSYQMKWNFVNGTTTNWVRFGTATSGGLLKPNPTIDYTSGNKLSFWLNATVPVQIIGWNTDTDGNWSDASKWAGTATTGDNIPNTASEIARFLPTTAARTVTLDQDFIVNGLNFNSPKTYTVAGSNYITLNSPTSSGIDGSLTVQAGNHVITANMETRVRVAVSIAAGASLKTGGIAAVDATLNPTYETTSFVKSGDGSYDTGFLRYDTVTLSAGTTKITADGTANGTSEMNAISFAGGVAPTSKLDITNNALIVDYDTLATPARPTPFQSIRARIINGYAATADWSGNGITSSSAALQPTKYAIGYAEAASLNLTTFGGRPVDAEAVVIRYTLKGDADLSGNVNFDDLIKLAQSYNGIDKIWINGDFNYDGNVNFDDLIPLAQNYNSALTPLQAAALGSDFAADFALAQSLVPEPTTLGLLGGLATMALRRRRD